MFLPQRALDLPMPECKPARDHDSLQAKSRPHQGPKLCLRQSGEAKGPRSPSGLRLCKRHGAETHFNSFLSLLVNVRDSAPDVITGLAWLNYYLESSEEALDGLDVGMRVLLGAILVGKTDVHNDMMNQRPVDESIVLTDFARKMGIQINVYEGNRKTEYVRQNPGTYPLISMVKGDFGYALLYTEESLRIELDPAFSKIDLVKFPFLCVKGSGDNESRSSYETSNRFLESWALKT